MGAYSLYKYAIQYVDNWAIDIMKQLCFASVVDYKIHFYTHEIMFPHSYHQSDYNGSNNNTRVDFARPTIGEENNNANDENDNVYYYTTTTAAVDISTVSSIDMNDTV